MSAYLGAPAVSPEVKAVLIRTPHFWFTLIAVSISAALGVELVPPGRLMKLALMVQAILTWYGYQAGVQFRSPSPQWPMAQRIAMQLAPLPPLPADVPRSVTEAMYAELYKVMGNVLHSLPQVQPGAPGVPQSAVPSASPLIIPGG